MKQKSSLSGQGCLWVLIFCVVVGVAWTVLNPAPNDDTYIAGMGSGSTTVLSRTRDDWDHAAQLQATAGQAAAGAYQLQAGAFEVPNGTSVHVMLRAIGQYGVTIAQVRLNDGRVGWINRAALPADAR